MRTATRALLGLALGCLVILAGGPAQAHSGSYDMKYVDGSNLILLTFNTHQPVSGLDIEHDIRLYDLVGAPIPYDEVKVEIHTRKNTDGVNGLESSLLDEQTLPMLPTNESKTTLAYPVSGSYTLTTVFYAGGREISRGEFAIDIAAGSSGPVGRFGWWSLGAAFVLGALVMRLVPRRQPVRSTRPDQGAAPSTESQRQPDKQPDEQQVPAAR